MKLAALTLACAALLCACETVETWPTEEEMATFGNGSNNALVLLSATDNFGCGSTSLAFMDMQAQANFDRTVFTGETSAAVVKPGMYHLFYGKCDAAVGDLKGITYWFDSVEVKPNEVVYIGTFNLTTISVASQANALQNVFSLGISAFTGNPKAYPVYEMRDETEKVRAHLREKYPQLAAGMVTRLPPAILSRDDFAQAFRNAYARRPDGSMPTEEEARGRLDGEIVKAIDASIAKYKAAHPEWKDAPAPPPPPAAGHRATPAS